MDRKIVYVSFYTEKYEKAAMRLKASLDKLGLDNDVVSLKIESWYKAVSHKPTFILEMMKKHTDAYAIVWVDADGDVVQKPQLFYEMDEDIGARFIYWPKGVDELLSGTLFIKNTPHMVETMEKWIETLAKIDKLPDSQIKKSCPEQSVLLYMLGNTVDTKVNGYSSKLGVSYRKLPEPYCRILKDRGRRGVDVDSVVVHYQFSRETRTDRTPAAHLSNPTKVVANKKPRHIIKPEKPKKVRAKPQKTLKRPRKPAKKVVSVKKSAPLKMPSEVVASRRRRAIRAARRLENDAVREQERTQAALKLAAGHRNRKLQQARVLEGDLVPQPCGGVRGNPPSKNEIAIMRACMSRMNVAPELDGMLANNDTVVVLGNSPTIDEVPPDFLKRFPIIGCNRALRHKTLQPDFLIMADREPYCQELRTKRLLRASEQGKILLFSDSIFDPTILLRGPYDNKDRRAQPAPDLHGYIYRIGPRKKPWTYETVMRGIHKLPINTKTFESPVVSCLNIAGSLLQCAAILGAKTIITLGIEFRWEGKKSHFFGDGSKVGAYRQDASLDMILSAMKQIKLNFKKDGIRVINISPITDSPFAKVFKTSPINDIIGKYGDIEPFNREILKKPPPMWVEFDPIKEEAEMIIEQADKMMDGNE